MLTIRTEQLQTLTGVSYRAFEDQLVDHCRSFAERLFQLRGEACIRRVVRTGMQQAREQGFTRRGPVRFWIELMFAFGHRFASDPQLTWSAAALADTSLAEADRAARLFAAMQGWQLRVEGPAKAWALAALRNVAALPWDQIIQPGAAFEAQALAAMQRIYPQKAQAAGDDALRRIVAQAEAHADAHNIAALPQRALLAGLMFGFGHGVLDDPLYPWVAATLSSGRYADIGQRTERLAAKTRIYVDAMARHLDDNG